MAHAMTGEEKTKAIAEEMMQYSKREHGGVNDYLLLIRSGFALYETLEIKLDKIFLTTRTVDVLVGGECKALCTVYAVDVEGILLDLNGANTWDGIASNSMHNISWLSEEEKNIASINFKNEPSTTPIAKVYDREFSSDDQLTEELIVACREITIRVNTIKPVADNVARRL